jgi:sigma-B regulation protein RsbU (phosphoserine phosphatase)
VRIFRVPVPKGENLSKLNVNKPRLTAEDALVLLELASDLSAVKSFEELSLRVLTGTKSATSAEKVALVLPDRGRTSFSVLVNPVTSEEKISSCRLPASLSFPARVMQSDTSMLLLAEELDSAQRAELETLLGTPPKTTLCAPLMTEGEKWGAICCFNKTGESVFSERDAFFLEGVAKIVSPHLRTFSFKRDLRKGNLEKELLYDIGRAVGSSLDVQSVMDSILDALQKILPYDAGGVFLLKPGSLEIQHLAARGVPEENEDKLRLKVGVGLVGWAIKEGQEVIVPDTRQDNRYVEARPATRSEIVVPLVAGNNIIGALSLESDRMGAFTEDHVDLLFAFANQAAIMIERTRLHEELIKKRWLEEELKIARQIQLSFLPSTCPLLDGFELCGTNLSYEEVGGDYYDFVPIVDHQLGIAVADVSGKGIPASLIMASFRASLRAEIRNNYAIKTILTKVNRLLNESVESGTYVTAFYGVLDTRNRVLTFSNAGHNPPILLRADGKLELLFEGGTVLGALPGVTFKERRVSFSSGDLLVLYTDGVTDAVNEQGEELGQGGLERLVKSMVGLSAAAMMQGIIDGVAKFRGTARQNDDLTLVVLKAK